MKRYNHKYRKLKKGTLVFNKISKSLAVLIEDEDPGWYYLRVENNKERFWHGTYVEVVTSPVQIARWRMENGI